MRLEIARKNPKTPVCLLVLALGLFLAPSALAGRITNSDGPNVWFEGTIDDNWGTEDTNGNTNWLWLPSQDEFPLPPGGAAPWDKVYISTHGGAHHHEALAIIDVDPGTTFLSGQLYIGGWDADHLANVPDPGLPVDLGAMGHLQLKSGKLQVGEYGSSDFTYTRVGYHGGKGLLEQSGGTLHSNDIVSIAMGSEDSIGTYELTAGDVVSNGYNVGVQGFGVLSVSGGTLKDYYSNPDPEVDEEILPFRSEVGVGYNYTRQQGSGAYPNHEQGDGSGTIAGIGVADFSDGTVHLQGKLDVGARQGAFGAVHVRHEADVDLDGGIAVGVRGIGALIVNGGALDTAFVQMGFFQTGMGSIAVRDGTFTTSGKLDLGNAGAAIMTVTGQASQITLGSFAQGSRGQLVYEITELGITPIAVTGDARFSGAPGGLIRIELEDIANFTDSPPGVGDPFTLMTYGSRSGPSPKLDADSAGDWTLCASSTELKAIYGTGQTCP